MKPLVHHTIRGEYDPRNVQRYENVSKNGIPLVATYLEHTLYINDTLLLHRQIFEFLNQKLKRDPLNSSSSTKTCFRFTRTTKTAPDHCTFS